MHLVITGGHLTPAYALAEYAQSKGDTLSLITSESAHSPEVTEFTQLAIPSYHLKTVKYNRYQKLRSLIKLPGLIPAYVKALKLLNELKPDAILTFGSFMAVPVSLAAKTKGIPIILHEQTHAVGLANQLVAPIASACAISYPESAPRFPKNKTTVTGNLLRQEFFHPPETPPFPLPSNKPILYITGGSQGSSTILTAFTPLITKLVQHYLLVIQSGKTTFEPPLSVKTQLIHQPWFSPASTSWLMHHAHIVISRAGANTTAELMVAGVPAILIPLHGSASNEQMQNAQTLVAKQAALVIPQSDCTPDQLVSALAQIEKDYATFKHHAQSLQSTQQASAVNALYDLIVQTVDHS